MSEEDTIVEDFNIEVDNCQQIPQGNETLNNPVSIEYQINSESLPFNTVNINEVSPQIEKTQIEETNNQQNVNELRSVQEPENQIESSSPPPPEDIISDFQEDQILQEIKKKFYDSRAEEIRKSLLCFLAIFLVSNLINLKTKYEEIEQSENILKNTIFLVTAILLAISYIKKDLRYVRPAFYIYFLQEIGRFLYLDLSDFYNEQKFANLGSFILHIIYLLYSIIFYMIYSDSTKIFESLSGKFMLLATIVCTSKVFLFWEGQFLYNTEVFGIVIILALILLTFSIIYIKICQNITNQHFEQLLKNQEQRSIIKSILDNLEESIIITNQKQQRIDYVNDKFFDQFQEKMDERPPESSICKKKKKIPCHKRFYRQESQEIKIQTKDKFLEMKLLTEVKSLIQPEQIYVDQQQQNLTKTYSFNEILQKKPQDFQNLIYSSQSEDGDQNIKYFQIKLKKFQRNHERMTMLQLIDISKTILYDQQRAQNQVLSMINAQVSHEMRNPLNSIAAQNIQKHALYQELNQVVKVFEDNANNSNFAAQKQYLVTSFNKIFVQLMNGFKVQDSSVNLLTFIVQDLLDFAQIKSGNFRKNIDDFNIVEAVDEVMMIQRRKAIDNNINLSVQHIGEPVIQTDRQRVMQVLLGLQSNALKFTQNGEVKILVEVKEKKLKIQVQDTGIGISKENQKNLFQFFGKVQENGQMNTSGVGLGLVISKQIVKQFNGDITVQSELGVGSTFTFTFEISQLSKLQTLQINQNVDHQVQSLNSRSLFFPSKFFKYVYNLNRDRILSLHHDVSSDSDDPQKILIVDDQSFNIDALLIILKYRIGLNTKLYCQTALNGKQALNIIQQDAQNALNNGLKKSTFSLILMDCNMPDLDGYETTIQIRQYLSQNRMRQPIISAVTGHTEQVYIDRAFESGMNQVMSKPVPVDLLRDLVMKVQFPTNEK